MRLGEFRKLTEDFSDETELVIWENGDATWYEASLNGIVPATPIHPESVVVLDMGQQIELAFDLAVRTGIDSSWYGDVD